MESKVKNPEPSSSKENSISVDISTPDNYSTILKNHHNLIFNNSHKIFANNKENLQHFNKKVLVVPANLNAAETLDKIIKIDANKFSHLFVFDIKDPENETEILAILSETFQTNRPLIVQFSEASEHKIYYKLCEENNFKLLTHDQSNSNFKENFNLFINNKNFDDLIERIFITEDSLMMRFLYLFQLSEDQKRNFITKSAEWNNVELLKAALDLKFTNMKSQINPNIVKDVLKIAINKNNVKIVKFLVDELFFIIEKFLFTFKKSIVESAKSQEVLLPLLTKVDFPFPSFYQNIERMEIDDHSEDEISKLIRERDNFHTAINNYDWQVIEDMIEEDINLGKLAYNSKNQSAVKTALECKHIDIYIHLQNEGFLKSDNEDISTITSKYVDEITKENLENGIISNEKSIYIFTFEKSSFLNRIALRSRKRECFKKIKKFFKDLYKIKEAIIILEIAVKNPDLNIIFDFENEHVGEICPTASDSSGYVIYTMNQIFISAFGTLNDESDENNENEYERKVKRNLIHEIFHFVNDTIFENNGRPYYERDKIGEEDFESILQEYSYLSLNNNHENDDYKEDQEQNQNIVEEFQIEETDDAFNDGCYGIISRVFKYPLNERHTELIVRPIEIIIHFHENDKDNHLDFLKDEKYENLFKFFNELIEKIKNFDVEEKLQIKKLNGVIGTIQKIEESKIVLNNLNAINVPSENFFNATLPQVKKINHDYLVLKSNVPFMTLVNLHQNLSNQQAKILKSKNLFSTVKRMKNREIFKDFEKTMEHHVKKISKRNENNQSENASYNDEGYVDLSPYSSEQMEIDEIPLNNQENSIDAIGSSGIFSKFNAQLENLPNAPCINFHDKNLEIVLDCSKEYLETLKEILEVSEGIKITLITKSENYSKVLEAFKDKELTPETRIITHQFCDLKEESQQILLENYIYFQGNEFQLFNLITIEQAREIFNSELLFLLFDKYKFSINCRESNYNEENFDSLYSSRNILKKTNRKVPKILDESEYDKFKYNRNFIDIKEIPKTSTDKEKQIEVTEIITRIDGISQENFLEATKSQKYVLISDGAGNGKSWLLRKTFMDIKQKHPYNWVDFINLNKFYDIFKSIEDNTKFKDFYVEKILKNSAKLKAFETSTFIQLYNAGKVFILLDGFDEIATMCARELKILIKTFDEQNYGNQLWITTRSNFEIDLQYYLEIESVYNLEPLKKNEFAKYIAQLWHLSPNNQETFNDHLRNARKLLDDKNIIKKSAIGLPQLLRMIAEIYEDYKSETKRAKTEISLFSCYKMLVAKHIKGWMESPLRREQCVRAQDDLSNYSEIHQFYSMQYYFEGEKFCDLIADWTEEEIEGGGLAKIINNRIYFNHETFLEFFVASFINRLITKKTWENHEDFFDYFSQIFTDLKFTVVRSFLNDSINEILNLIKNKLNLFSENLLKKTDNNQKVKIFCNIFDENCEENLKFFTNVLNYDNSDNLKEIFHTNVELHYQINVNLLTFCGFKGFVNIFKIFLNFISLKMSKDELKNFLLINDTLTSFAKSSYNFGMFENVLLKIDEEFQERDTKIVFIKLEYPNIFRTLCSINHENIFYQIHDAQNPQKADNRAKKFTLIYDFLKRNGFEQEKMKKLLDDKFNFYDTTILHNIVVLKDSEMLKVFYEKIKNDFSPPELLKFLKKLNVNDGSRNFLQMSAYIDSYKFHETLWSLSISNGILLKIINQKDCYENSYLHILVSFSDEKIIQLVFDKIKEKLPGEFKNLLKIKGFRNRNLLQKAADKQENVKVHKFLWDLFYESCNSVESFINFLKKGDDQGDTTLHLIVKFSTAAVFEFAFEYFEKFNLTNLKIKEILLWREKNDRNFLQTAAILNKSLDLHKCLWKIIEKFVPEDEIISMIEHKDKINCNLLFAIVRFNNKEITEFTWEKIKEYLKTHQQQKEYLEEKGYKGNNLYKNVTYRNYEVSRWVKNILFEYGII